MRAALKRVQARHPLLQMRIVDRPEPWFTSVDAVDVPLRIIRRDNDDTWRVCVEEEMNLPFDAKRGPLVRFTLVLGDAASELVCAYHHALADGLSGFMLLNEVVLSASDTNAPLPPLPFRPPVETLIAGATRGTDALGAAVGHVASGLHRASPLLDWVARRFPPSSGRGPKHMEAIAPDHPRPFRTHLLRHVVEPERTRALLARCRQHGTPIQTVLGAALALALTEARARPERTTISCTLAVNARPYLREPVADEFGCYAFGVTTAVRTHPGASAIDLAHELNATLTPARQRRSLLIQTAASRSLDCAVDLAQSAWMERLSRAAIGGIILVSNLGRPAFLVQGRASAIRGLSMGATVRGIDMAAGAATIDERLGVTFMYVTPTMTSDTADRIALRVIALLTRDG
ncbi:tuba protein [Sorangium cellulosum]|uniref:Phthiocerol/phthiodiolone dimycocerosyl transferase n=1 Tax=Sorangium cellulosum TaxID=56 RepID=A0A4P2R6U2_SORCE|nr:tuba protein [Sorangium cellulosum]WCQ97870.1 hypothetical protein NQZ70_10668 [Sorangium sp. Soce836]